MEDFAHIIGTMPFTVAMSSSSGKLAIGLRVETSRMKWTEAFGRKMVEVDPAVVLSTLSGYWNKIAGPYADQPSNRFSLDLSLLANAVPLGKVTYVRDGVNVSFVSDHGTTELGAESVIPVEVLLAAGNLLAEHAPPHLAKIWERVSVPTQLPPFTRLDMDMSQSDAERTKETEWYAKACGQSVEYYERLANWLHARQLAFAVGAEGYAEPTREEYSLDHAPEDVPSMAEIDAIYALSKDRLGTSLEELHQQAVDGRTITARSRHVFRRFFPKS